MFPLSFEKRSEAEARTGRGRRALPARPVLLRTKPEREVVREVEYHGRRALRFAARVSTFVFKEFFICEIISVLSTLCLKVEENVSKLQKTSLNNYRRCSNIIADYRTQSLLSSALQRGISFGNDRSPTPFRPMGAQRRRPPRQWEDSVCGEGARHFVAGTPFLQSGCSRRSRRR